MSPLNPLRKMGLGCDENFLTDKRTGVASTLEKAVARLGSMSLTGSKSKVPADITSVLSTSEKTDAQLRNEKVEVPQLEGKSFLRSAFQDMLIAMPHIFAAGRKGEEEDLGNEPKLVIAFDEAHPLSKLSSKGFRPLHILGRVINSYSHKRCTSLGCFCIYDLTGGQFFSSSSDPRFPAGSGSWRAFISALYQPWLGSVRDPSA